MHPASDSQFNNPSTVRLSNPDQPLLLGYRSRGEPIDAAVGPLWPVLSVLPGLLSWLLFASAAMPRELPVVERLSAAFGSGTTSAVVLGAWGLSAASSVAALIVFARRPQAWYTTLCMAVHLAGLLFSLLLLGGLAVLLVA